MEESTHIDNTENGKSPDRNVMQGYEDKRQVLDEFFTPYWVADIMFRLAKYHGYTSGKILEPSFGGGVFLDVLTDSGVNESDIFGFEIYKPNYESVKRKYPLANLHDHNFEYQFIEKDLFFSKNKIKKSSEFKEASFDLVIGNPPYGYHKSPHGYYFNEKVQIRIEGFFIHLSLQKLKKGGLLVFIINSLWLQNGKTYNKQKEMISEIGELVDAYRLPNGIFKGGNRDTDIATDIVIFRKK